METNLFQIYVKSLKVPGRWFWSKPKYLIRQSNTAVIEIKSGEMTLLRGDNGSGKSSLIESLFGQRNKQLEGEIRLNGNPKVTNDTAKNLTYLSQEVAERYKKDSTVLDYIEGTLNERLTKGDKIITQEEIKPMLEIFFGSESAKELGRMIFKKISGGQKKIVQTIATLLLDKPFYVFDEPINHLDNEKSKILISEFNRLMKLGKGILIISHCMIHLQPHRIYLIENQKIYPYQFSNEDHPCLLCKQVLENK
jgi:ABC-type multidrug transport system ATPase subunit